jgi:hypothetical protein
LLQGANRNITLLKGANTAYPSLYPLDCRQGEALSEEGNMMGKLTDYTAQEKKTGKIENCVMTRF